mgnify:CR=1 FL=1
MSTISCAEEPNQNDYHMIFKGELSKRNGGFCGARARNANPAYDLSEYEGI